MITNRHLRTMCTKISERNPNLKVTPPAVHRSKFKKRAGKFFFLCTSYVLYSKVMTMVEKISKLNIIKLEFVSLIG